MENNTFYYEYFPGEILSDVADMMAAVHILTGRPVVMVYNGVEARYPAPHTKEEIAKRLTQDILETQKEYTQNKDQEAKSKHSFETAEDCGCNETHCCPRCVLECKICGLAEGWLTTECPGYEVPYSMGELVGRNEIDFVGGKWRERH